MKKITLLLLVLLSLKTTAQIQFEQIPDHLAEIQTLPEFDGVYQGSIAFADVDGDEDQDVLITGYNRLGEKIAKLYTNDSTGVYTEVPGTPFELDDVVERLYFPEK